MLGFLVLLLALSLGAVALGIPRANNGPHLAALALVLIVYVGLMGLICTLDRPFGGGALSVEPTAMEFTAADIEEDYEEAHEKPLPCDGEGNPRSTASA